ncbi:MAG: asparaginase [Actinobacteria bacterium]|nr:asparaginase [Actinomycetota bacterium]
MRIGAVRSGLVEARYEVSVVAATSDGAIASFGDAGDEFFLRSAAKPFQAAISQQAGAALGTEQLAVACGSHGAHPIHIAYVRKMLTEVGLDEGHLLCPAVRPSSMAADRRWAASGDLEERPVFHNCSGKHAAMLRACVARGWPLSYTDPEHPLQQRVVSFLGEMTGCDPTPVGVDGCGVPTVRSTVAGLAAGFARLASDPRLAEVAAAMYRYAPLTSHGDRAASLLSRWGASIVKGGAMGCVGVAHQSGVGIAAKCWSGDFEVAVVGAIEMMRHLGLLPDYPQRQLAEVANPPVLGGGRPVGAFEVVGG